MYICIYIADAGDSGVLRRARELSLSLERERERERDRERERACASEFSGAQAAKKALVEP